MYVLVINIILSSLLHRIDVDYVIKVSDFGLSENVYARNYFRQGSTAGGPVKLPVKWMAPESLTDNLFSEKSDVVRLLIRGE